MGVAGLAAAAQQRLGINRVDAGLALDRLDQHRRRVSVDSLDERVRVVAAHHLEARHERRERGLLGLVGGRGQRPHRAPVKAALQHDEVAAPAAPARQLERAFDRLGSRVAEKDAPAERAVREVLRKPNAGLGVVEVPDVHQAPRLLADRLHEPRVAVPELHDRDAGQEVEVLIALVVPEPRALAAHELDRVAGVGRHHRVALECLELR